MEAVEIETCITLSRVAAGDIPFGAPVERYAAKTAKIYGGEVISECNALWTAGHANVTVSVQTAAFDIWEDAAPYMVRAACAAVPDTTNVMYTSFTATDMSGDSYFYVLARSSVALTAGDIDFGTDETAAFASPQLTACPAMAANTWYMLQLAWTGTTADRNAVICFGCYNSSGGAWTGNLDIQYVGRGNNLYGILGFAKDDQVSIHDTDNDPTETYEAYDDVTVLAAGHINADLIKGATCVSGQPLYIVPGCGKLATTQIVDANRTITATEDQTVSGGRVGVRI